jgi:hypothetical protein
VLRKKHLADSRVTPLESRCFVSGVKIHHKFIYMLSRTTLRTLMTQRSMELNFRTCLGAHGQGNGTSQPTSVVPFYLQECISAATGGKGETTVLIPSRLAPFVVPFLEQSLTDCELIVQKPKVELWTPVQIDWS